MQLSVGDMQILYYMAFKGSNPDPANPNKPKDSDAKAAELIEDAMRGEV